MDEKYSEKHCNTGGLLEQIKQVLSENESDEIDVWYKFKGKQRYKDREVIVSRLEPNIYCKILHILEPYDAYIGTDFNVIAEANFDYDTYYFTDGNKIIFTSNHDFDMGEYEITYKEYFEVEIDDKNNIVKMQYYQEEV